MLLLIFFIFLSLYFGLREVASTTTLTQQQVTETLPANIHTCVNSVAAAKTHVLRSDTVINASKKKTSHSIYNICRIVDWMCELNGMRVHQMNGHHE